MINITVMCLYKDLKNLLTRNSRTFADVILIIRLEIGLMVYLKIQVIEQCKTLVIILNE